MRYIVLFLALAACGSSSEPVAPFSVSLTPAATVQGHATLVNGSPAYACDFPLVITASGGDSQSFAIWAGGPINWRLNANGQLATTFFLQSDVIAWFGRDRITPGQAYTATRTLTWSGPYTASLIFNYSVGTMKNGVLSFDDRSATVALVCV